MNIKFSNFKAKYKICIKQKLIIQIIYNIKKALDDFDDVMDMYDTLEENKDLTPGNI